MSVQINGEDVTRLDEEHADLMRMSSAAALAGGMIATANRATESTGSAISIEEAFKIFAQVYEKMHGRVLPKAH